ncbi:MAG: AAA family ATPase [Azonexus sp.]
MNLQSLIDSRLSSASPSVPGSPEAIIVVGPIASGKTTFRKTTLGSGYVHIDSADIFHELSNGDPTLDFPTAFLSEIDYIGRHLTKEALDRQLPVVLEAPGHDAEQLISLINALKSIGYKVEISALSTDEETCELQNATRGDNVSSYWAAPIHVEWVIAECELRRG